MGYAIEEIIEMKVEMTPIFCIWWLLTFCIYCWMPFIYSYENKWYNLNFSNGHKITKSVTHLIVALRQTRWSFSNKFSVDLTLISYSIWHKTLKHRFFIFSISGNGTSLNTLNDKEHVLRMYL
jgi:hypothetical protein